MSAETIVNVVDKLGVPAAILVALALGGIYCAVRVARWVAPQAEKVVEGHRQLLVALSDFSTTSRGKIEAIHGRVEEIGRDVDTIKQNGCAAKTAVRQ